MGEHAPVLDPLPAAHGLEAGVFVPLPPSVPTSRKIRILCLHGTASSEGVLTRQLGVLSRYLAVEAELVYVTSSLACDSSNPLVTKECEAVKSFFPDETLMQWCVPIGEALGWRHYDGLEKAVAEVQEKLRINSPIDVLLGFSQGSNVAHCVAAQAVRGRGPLLRCVIHMATGKPGWVEQMPEFFQHKNPLPSLIIEGASDMTASGSDAVASTYETVERFKHSEGHRPFPRKVEEQKMQAEVIKQFVMKHCL